MSESSKSKWAFSEAHFAMFPELRYFTEGEAPMEDLEVYLRFQRGWPATIAIVVCMGGAYPLFHLFHRVFGISRGYAAVLLVFAQLFVMWLLLSMVIPRIRRRQIRAALRDHLQQLGIPTCRKCAYDLRGSPERCPECGTQSR